MSNPHPISNRQRKMLERQAERNRELAASKRGDTRTPFREAELRFLSRQPPPDYSGALDFRLPDELLLKDGKVKKIPLTKPLHEVSPLFGHDSSKGASLPAFAYLHSDHPGLLYIPAGFSPSAQRSLIKSCLKEYSRHPNKSNLDTHYLVPDSGLWELHESVFSGKLSSDHPSALVQRKASPNNQSNGYGSDEDDEEATGRGQSTPLPSKPSVRTLVPIPNGSEPAPQNMDMADPEPSAQVPILPPSQLLRKMRWITLGYQYHWPSKTYHFDQNAPFPEELSAVSKAVVKAIEGASPFPYSAGDFVAEAGVVNYYQLKDRLMGHVDRSELNKDAPLVSFSFGHSCVYLLGGATREVAPTPILLQSGDILVMTGPCRSAFHGVPRIIEGTLPKYLGEQRDDPDWSIYADYMSEARINLNIRQVYPPVEHN